MMVVTGWQLESDLLGAGASTCLVLVLPLLGLNCDFNMALLEGE